MKNPPTQLGVLRKRIWCFIKSDEGSATVEFILLALPLFVPIAIFLVSVDSGSTINFETRNLSRQIARAYVSGTDQVNAEARVSAVLSVFHDQFGRLNGVNLIPTIEITCSDNPCLSTGGSVEITVIMEQPTKGIVARSSTVETVDRWR
jgi:Flp pilus assembly protein TadG